MNHCYHQNNNKPNKFLVFIMLISSILMIIHGLQYNSKRTNDIHQAEIADILSEKDETQELLINVKLDNSMDQAVITNDISPLKIGDRLYVQSYEGEHELSFNIVTIHKNTNSLILLSLLAVMLIAVSRQKGFYALISLFFSLGLIIDFIIPQILAGHNPILVALIGSIITLIGTIYISYGFNKKSIAALLSIIITLILVSILSIIFVYKMHFSGYGNEAAMYINLESDVSINLIGLIIAGIIVASIGVLDDIAITQSSLIFQLHESNPSLSKKEIFKKAMTVGNDHISAVVNTLVMAYAGAALPLLLLFWLNGARPDYILSTDMVAEEIVRTLASSIGLIMAVPITTYISLISLNLTSKCNNITFRA